MKRLQAFALFFGATLAMAAQTGWALDLNPNEIRGKSSKEPVSVLQNRYFLKAFRPEFGMMAGQVIDEAYLDTSLAGGRVGMFFNEWLGVDIQMARTTVRDSADRTALNSVKYLPLPERDASGNAIPADPTAEQRVVTPDPEVNAVHAMQDVTAVAAPFYGKLNLLNKWIVYTDLYFTSGYTRVETDQGTKNGMSFGVGQRFYLGKAVSVRIDARDRIYRESRAGKPTSKNTYSWDLGLSYFFN